EVLAEVAEIVKRVDQIRFEVECAPVARRGLLAPASVSHNVAEVVVKLGNSVVGRDRLTDLPDRDFGMPPAVRQQSEHMKAASVVRIDRKDLSVVPLGVDELPGSMTAERRLEHLCELGVEAVRCRRGAGPNSSDRAAPLLSIHWFSVPISPVSDST